MSRATFSIVPLPGKVTFAGFKRSQFRVYLKIAGGISPIAQLYIVLHDHIFGLGIGRQVYCLHTETEMNKAGVI